jgi:hypothetical protein
MLHGQLATAAATTTTFLFLLKTQNSVDLPYHTGAQVIENWSSSPPPHYHH